MENVMIIAMKAIIIHNHKVLIVKRSITDSISPGIWEFAGGKLEFGENLEEGLMRETVEETGLNVTVEKMLFATTFKTNEHRQVVIITYLCHSKTNDIRLSDEHDDYRWVGKKKLLELITKRMSNDLKINNILEQLDLSDD